MRWPINSTQASSNDLLFTVTSWQSSHITWYYTGCGGGCKWWRETVCWTTSCDSGQTWQYLHLISIPYGEFLHVIQCQSSCPMVFFWQLLVQAKMGHSLKFLNVFILALQLVSFNYPEPSISKRNINKTASRTSEAMYLINKTASRTSEAMYLINKTASRTSEIMYLINKGNVSHQ